MVLWCCCVFQSRALQGENVPPPLCWWKGPRGGFIKKTVIAFSFFSLKWMALPQSWQEKRIMSLYINEEQCIARWLLQYNMPQHLHTNLVLKKHGTVHCEIFIIIINCRIPSRKQRTYINKFFRCYSLPHFWLKPQKKLNCSFRTFMDHTNCHNSKRKQLTKIN